MFWQSFVVGGHPSQIYRGHISVPRSKMKQPVTPIMKITTATFPEEAVYDHVNTGNYHQLYGQSKLISGYDSWYQGGPSNSWSADSTSSSSDSSLSVDPLDEGPNSSSKSRRTRNDRRSSNRRTTTTTTTKTSTSSSPPFPSMLVPTVPHPPCKDVKRKLFGPPPRSIPTWSPDKCVALDAEMVGVGRYGEDSSVARVVLVDWDGKVLFDEYIKQTQAVTDFRTFISGIKPEHLSEATLSFRDARKQILSILYGRFLIGHGLKNDLKALGISHPWWLIRDTARYEPFMQTLDDDQTLWPRKLKDLSLEVLGKDIQTYGKPHCPCEDAMAAMNLYKTVKDEWEQLTRKKVAKTNEIQAGERNFQKKMAAQQQQWAHQQQLAYLQVQQHMMWQQQQQQHMHASPHHHHHNKHQQPNHEFSLTNTRHGL